MALRVLLADNSESIRRVIQLSLQDFAVDVRNVNHGLDVLDVARQTRPDIIFVDILLQKRNGYEVSFQLKSDPDLKPIPVVLMWSGFMDFDESKAKACLADARLEKPFDSEMLRNVVRQYVPKLSEPGFHDFLIPPKIEKPPESTVNSMPIPAPTPTVVPVSDLHPPVVPISALASPVAPMESADPSPIPEQQWNMDQFDPIPDVFQNPNGISEDTVDLSSELPDLELELEQPKLILQPIDPPPPVDDNALEHFSKVDIQKLSDMPLGEFGGPRSRPTDDNETGWMRRDLKSFQLDLPPGAELGEVVVDPLQVFSDPVISPLKDDTTTEKSRQTREPAKLASVVTSLKTIPNIEALKTEDVESFIKAQGPDIIREIALKIIPQIAPEIIQKEIRRLIEESAPPL